jgi:hypothetical protein
MNHLINIVVCVALFASLFEADAAEPPTRRAQHVIVVGVDGIGATWVPAATTPNLNWMTAEGASTMTARGGLPTSSSSNWGSILTGVGVEQHGITSNGWQTNNFSIPPRILGPGNMFPTIFALLREQMPGSFSSIACGLVFGTSVNTGDTGASPTRVLHQKPHQSGRPDQ